MAYFKYDSKEIYYYEIGQGKPILLLHGNTASSKMFELLLPMYQQDFKVILIDFLGHGKSDRVDKFPCDIWKWQADQTIALLKYLGYQTVSLVGTSGGAWVAINVALKRPDLVSHVVADSFDGRTLNDDFKDNLIIERRFAIQDEMSIGFYRWCQGNDWKKVVELDTNALLECATLKKSLFFKDIKTLERPILFTGSKADKMCRKDLVEEYQIMVKIINNARMFVFDSGEHPSICTNAKETFLIIKNFIYD